MTKDAGLRRAQSAAARRFSFDRKVPFLSNEKIRFYIGKSVL